VKQARQFIYVGFSPIYKFAADEAIPANLFFKLPFIALAKLPQLVRVNEGGVSAVIDRRRSYFDTIKSELSVNFKMFFASFFKFSSRF